MAQPQKQRQSHSGTPTFCCNSFHGGGEITLLFLKKTTAIRRLGFFKNQIFVCQ